MSTPMLSSRRVVALRCVERRTVPYVETLLATSARPLLTESVAVITLLAPGSNATARRGCVGEHSRRGISKHHASGPRRRAGPGHGGAIPRGRAVQRRPLRGTGGPARAAPGRSPSAAPCRRGDVAIVATAAGIDARKTVVATGGSSSASSASICRGLLLHGTPRGHRPQRRFRKISGAESTQSSGPTLRDTGQRFSGVVSATTATIPTLTTQGAAGTPSVVGPRLTHPGRARCQSSQGSRFEYAPRCHFAT